MNTFLQILFTTYVQIKTLPCRCTLIMCVQYTVHHILSLFIQSTSLHSKCSIVLASLNFFPFFNEIIELAIEIQQGGERKFW
jgi:hypothetical protein